MKFDFSSNKAAKSARNAMMTIISIVTLSFNTKDGWSVLATTILGGGATQNQNLLGFKFSAAQLTKAIKEGHARNKRIQPMVSSERTTPCYEYSVVDGVLNVVPVFPADIVPLHEAAGEGFQVKLSHPQGTDASALEIVNALRKYDPKGLDYSNPTKGTLIFSLHCVYNARHLNALASVNA